MKVCLCIIFNHRYDSNINKLKQIYKKRFDVVRFLVPFYDGDDKEVITVYECSYQFQGYLIQAYSDLLELNADYYFFIADDIALNPHINQENVIDELCMCDNAVFFTYLREFNSDLMLKEWSHALYSSKPFLSRGGSWQDSLPEYNEALNMFQSFLLHKYPEKYDGFFRGADSKLVREFLKFNGGNNRIPYPMARGYSDIFIIRSDKLYNISRTSGIFAAMNLFVELALPTSIVLNCSVNEVVKLSMTHYKCLTLWGEDISANNNRYRYAYDDLIAKWDSEILFMHPIKLSKWNSTLF